MNSKKEDVGVLKDYTFDLAFGSDENDFECAVNINNNVCKAGYYLYYEDSEYGGIIDSVNIDTENKTVTYKGRTWHGILNSKVFVPDTACDYLTVSGDANTIIDSLLSRIGLKSLFKASENQSGINISSYKMNRYISGYDGIIKMLKTENGKLDLKFKKGFVELSAKPLIDYSEDEQFNSDQIGFDIQRSYSPVNHCICLGKGELRDRRVIHIYVDKYGYISGTQKMFGMDEVVSVYENANTETDDELIEGGIDIIKNSWASSSVDFSFNSNDEFYDIGDLVGAKENTTGIVVKGYISKKIVKIENNTTSISYDCEGSAVKESDAEFPASGEGGTEGIIKISDWFTLIGEGSDLYASHSDEVAPTFQVDSDGNLYVEATGVSFEVDENNNIFCIEI